MLKQFFRAGYPSVNLSVDGVRLQRRVHQLMADAFGIAGDGPFVRHLDDVKTNNVLENLCRGTPQENTADAIRNGKFVPKGYPVRPHCKRGHEFTPENIFPRPEGDGRGCRKCRALRAERYRKRRRERL